MLLLHVVMFFDIYSIRVVIIARLSYDDEHGQPGTEVRVGPILRTGALLHIVSINSNGLRTKRKRCLLGKLFKRPASRSVYSHRDTPEGARAKLGPIQRLP